MDIENGMTIWWLNTTNGCFFVLRPLMGKRCGFVVLGSYLLALIPMAVLGFVDTGHVVAAHLKKWV